MASITQLKYILSVDRNRHFGKAAKECGVSQPSLSIQISKVEQEYDIIIFDRTKKPILITETGKDFISQSKIILKEYELLGKISAQSDTPRGDFKLAIIPTMGPYLTPLFLKNFTDKFPEVNLSILEHKTDEIIDLLDRDLIDAGILATPLKNDLIIERVLFYEPFHVFFSKEHQFKNKDKIEIEDLSSEGLWLLGEGHCLRNQALNLCASRNLKNKVNLESGNLETIINLIRGTSGHTLLPHLSLKNLCELERTYQIKDIKSSVPTREVSLVHSRSFLKEAIIIALEKEILESVPVELKSFKRTNTNVVDLT